MRGAQVDGHVIKQLRKTKGWTQEQLAQDCECSVRTVRNIEQSEKRIDVATLVRVADALEVTVADLTVADANRFPASLLERHMQIVADWQQAYISCDVDRILQFHQPDTVLEMPGSESLEAGGTFRGIDELRAHLESAFQHIRVAEVHDEKVHAVDNLVFSRPLSTMLAIPTGKTFTARFLNEFEFRDEKICRRLTIVDWGLYRKSLGMEPD